MVSSHVNSQFLLMKTNQKKHIFGCKVKCAFDIKHRGLNINCSIANGGIVMFRINRGSENSVKYNKRGAGINGRLFVYFDPNDVNVSKFVYVRTKFLFMKWEKVLKQCENKFFRFKNITW